MKAMLKKIKKYVENVSPKLKSLNPPFSRRINCLKRSIRLEKICTFVSGEDVNMYLNV